jgi:hypothetical protein
MMSGGPRPEEADPGDPEPDPIGFFGAFFGVFIVVFGVPTVILMVIWMVINYLLFGKLPS